MDKNEDLLIDLKPVFMVYILPDASVGLADCISIVVSIFKVWTHLTTMLRCGFL